MGKWVYWPLHVRLDLQKIYFANKKSIGVPASNAYAAAESVRHEMYGLCISSTDI